LHTTGEIFALQTAGEKLSKSVTLFALQTAGEKLSHYLLYKQQVKIGHIICFTYSR
jgi:hypothetical protein